ncbi:MAG: antitoxin [Bifidobacteriaceae bacterium]|nr:antitoxin [Bifidobacteriaceae bacterium]
MATLTLRNVPAATHRALVARAHAAHRSIEAEARLILDAAVRPPERIALGSLLSRIGAETEGLDIAATSDVETSEPMSFE